MSLPPRLQRHLIDTGVLTERGTSRRARMLPCRHCNAGVVSGLDADVMAFDCDADPVRLSAVGEVNALVDGRRTFELVDRGARAELDSRDEWTIRSRPAGAVPVLAEHVCGRPVPAGWAAPPIAPPTQAVDHEEPGF